MTEEDLPEELPKFDPKVFITNKLDQIPSGFNSVCLTLDGRMRSDMNWKKEQELARDYAAKGFKILWYLDLGLFSSLDYPYNDEMQFQSLVLSLHHFRDSLWQEFKEETVGLSIFHGSVDFSSGFRWDEHQREAYQNWLNRHDMQDTKSAQRLYCCETASDYLRLLSQAIPDPLPLFLCLNQNQTECSSLEIARFTSQERFDRFALLFQEGKDRLVLAERENIKIALCLPEINCVHPKFYEGLEEAFQALEEKKIPYRIIPECQLTTEWDGLDYLIYSPKGLTPQGKRKLLGFCAAGGTPVSTGDLLGMPLELKIDDLMISY